jgi:glycosyltransferase involved in cell wall biosynthesis
VKVSVVIPIYNEKTYIRELVRRVLDARLPDGFDREVVVVDDGSDDGTTQLLLNETFPPAVRVIASAKNRGKGAALAAGFAIADGDVVLVQDGDLEYDPLENYQRLLQPFADPAVRVVYGSRFLTTTYPRDMALPNWLANQLLSFTARLLYRSDITDEATGYKVLRRDVLDEIELTATGFAFCSELTAKLLKRGITIVEVPISYAARNILQGKKIAARDGLVALYTLARHRLP